MGDSEGRLLPTARWLVEEGGSSRGPGMTLPRPRPLRKPRTSGCRCLVEVGGQMPPTTSYGVALPRAAGRQSPSLVCAPGEPSLCPARRAPELTRGATCRKAGVTALRPAGYVRGASSGSRPGVGTLGHDPTPTVPTPSTISAPCWGPPGPSFTSSSLPLPGLLGRGGGPRTHHPGRQAQELGKGRPDHAAGGHQDVRQGPGRTPLP